MRNTELSNLSGHKQLSASAPVVFIDQNPWYFYNPEEYNGFIKKAADACFLTRGVFKPTTIIPFHIQRDMILNYLSNTVENYDVVLLPLMSAASFYELFKNKFDSSLVLPAPYSKHPEFALVFDKQKLKERTIELYTKYRDSFLTQLNDYLSNLRKRSISILIFDDVYNQGETAYRIKRDLSTLNFNFRFKKSALFAIKNKTINLDDYLIKIMPVEWMIIPEKSSHMYKVFTDWKNDGASLLAGRGGIYEEISNLLDEWPKFLTPTTLDFRNKFLSFPT